MATRRPKKSSRQRSLVRADARQRTKLDKAREQLFVAKPGGSAERPLEVESSSMIEPRAGDVRCPICDVALRCEEHLARSVGDRRLREVVTVCPSCGRRRSLWFQIVSRLN